MKHFYRIFLRGLFLVALPAGGITFGTDYWIKSTRYVTTDNAYIKAHLLSISADLDGRATKVFVKQNDVVRMGDPLLDVDPEPFRIMLAKAEAELNSIKYEIKALQAELAEATAELSEVRAEITYLARVHGRQEKLYAKGISSRAKLDETERELTLTKQRARTVQHKIRRVMAKLGGSKNRQPEKHPMYLEAKAKVESAKLDLRRTRVFSPANGTVGKFSLQPGEFVERGRSLIPIIRSDEQWVEANLKETQLTHVRTGQRVEVIIDAYPDEPHEAQIVSISPSTGAELSILPPQNASGNWVKVVQRVPVKIEIADQEIIGKLRAGMTAHISIDTERRRSLFKIIKTTIAGSDIIE